MKKNNIDGLVEKASRKEIAEKVLIENLIKITIYGSRL
ncbi:hypothetical protein ATHSA_1222 [Athalassotoga saccharophila]|nr:hypothetical protein ATHSA_1222 [Athalassotoga saccharophila]